MRRLGLGAAVLCATVLVGSAPSSVWAAGQQAIEEVIVTARKREETIQDAPLAVSAFTGADLTAAGVKNISDLSNIVPGLQIDPSNAAQIWIRGVGQRDDSPKYDPGVGFYLDGVYVARRDGQLLDTLDFENVQVLRGPQGTLFGKNTNGGAILVTLRKPNDKLSGYIQGRLGNYNRQDAKAFANVPLISDTLFSSVTLSRVKRDGYIKNVVNGRHQNSENRLSGAFQLRWLPTDSVTVDNFVYWNKTNERGAGTTCTLLPANQIPSVSGTFGGTPVTLPRPLYTAAEIWPGGGLNAFSDACLRAQSLLHKYKMASDVPSQDYKLKDSLVGLTISWELNRHLTIKSITGYGNQRLNGNQTPDNDGSPLFVSHRIRTIPSDRDQVSQEFQFNFSGIGDRLNGTFGLFYFRENINDGVLTFAGPVSVIPLERLGIGLPYMQVQAPYYQRENVDQKNTTYAAFFQTSYDLTEWLQATAGLRWTQEKRDAKWKVSLTDTAAYLAQAAGIINSEGLGTTLSAGPDTLLFLPSDPTFTSDPLGAIQAHYPMNPNGLPQGYPLDQFVYKQNKTWNQLTPMASLSMHLDQWLEGTFLDDGMVYITYSQGFKSGAFDLLGVDGLQEIKPEKVKNVEIGIKLDAFHRRVRLDTAIYHMNYDNMQLRQVRNDSSGHPAVTFANAGKATMEGIELEFTWLPIDNLEVYLNGSFNDYKFDQFRDTTLAGQPIDRSNEKLPEVPYKTVSAGIQYTWETSIGSIIPRLSYSYTGKIYYGLDAGAWYARSASTGDAYQLYNFRLTWQSVQDKVRVTAYVDNLTDEKYIFGAASVGSTIGTFPQSLGPPRMYGVEARYNF